MRVPGIALSVDRLRDGDDVLADHRRDADRQALLDERLGAAGGRVLDRLTVLAGEEGGSEPDVRGQLEVAGVRHAWAPSFGRGRSTGPMAGGCKGGGQPMRAAQ
jgi:hypothetical protein